MTDLQFKISFSRVKPSGRVQTGCDYFATKAAAEKGKTSYEDRGFTVSEIEQAAGEASTVTDVFPARV